jgi:hypothetical protein
MQTISISKPKDDYPMEEVAPRTDGAEDENV